MRLRDKHGRYITDLRVSITDRCNYRCVYCRTGNQGAQYSELPFSDYLRMVRLPLNAHSLQIVAPATCAQEVLYFIAQHDGIMCREA